MDQRELISAAVQIAGTVDFAVLSAASNAGSPPSDSANNRATTYVCPGIELKADASTGQVLRAGTVAIVCAGRPVFRDGSLDAVARMDGPAAAWKILYEKHKQEAPAVVSGSFAVAFIDFAAGRLCLATDAFGAHSLCYRHDGQRIVFADRADAIAGPSAALSSQALFNYLFFHFIPSPFTVFADVARLPPRTVLIYDRQGCRVAPYASPGFDESSQASVEDLTREFKRLLRQAVERQATGARVGSFLSGGTDSSTVAGMLREVLGEPPRTYSIGFDAAGFDEVEYARIAARHFATSHREYYLSPEDVVAAVPSVAATYDQPFGNSSALPTYFCARLAREDGVERLLGGDGGDELFGGNARYGKQGIFEAYLHLPQPIRQRILEPLLLSTEATAKVPLVRKARSYLVQAKTPLPERLHSYNLLTRLGQHRILTSQFLQSIDAGEPLSTERSYYASANTSSWLNRVLFLDWKYTLADNDLPKVVQTCSLAGLTAAFPLLDLDLLKFANHLHPEQKVKGTRLRVFFKHALADFLPREIIEKKKHGFGMPFGLWMTNHKGLRDLAGDTLLSLRGRGIVREELLDELLVKLVPQHPSYYGELVWVLMMLEQWFLAKAPRFHV